MYTFASTWEKTCNTKTGEGEMGGGSSLLLPIPSDVVSGQDGLEALGVVLQVRGGVVCVHICTCACVLPFLRNNIYTRTRIHTYIYMIQDIHRRSGGYREGLAAAEAAGARRVEELRAMEAAIKVRNGTHSLTDGCMYMYEYMSIQLYGIT